MPDKILSREERIALAESRAPQNDTEARECRALGYTVEVNADMLALLQEDNAEQRARIAWLLALGEQLEHDRSLVAKHVSAAIHEIACRDWLIEGRGPYEWNDDRYQLEFGYAATAIREALEPLHKIAGDWSGCPMKADEIAKARIDLQAELSALRTKLETAEKLLNTPELNDFAKGVVSEAQHQRARWGSDHDAGKQPEDWFWLLGYLAGKCLAAQNSGEREKALHHTISTAAVLANWHASMLGIELPHVESELNPPPANVRCMNCAKSAAPGWMQIPGHDGEACPACNSEKETPNS